MNSVKTALRVLEAVAAHQPAGLSDLTRRLGLPKSTVQRCLATLHDAGWIRPGGHELTRWVVTGRAFSVGSQVANTRNLREVALPALSDLQAATLETIHLMVPDDAEMVLIERLDSAHELRTFKPLGSRAPLHATSNGKAVLAHLPAEEAGAYLSAHLEPVTAHTVTDPAALRGQLATVRRRGYAINEGELHDGVTSIGAAIVSDGRPVASLSISAPSSRLTPGKYTDYGARVVAAAQQIATALA
ncbi:MAG TPA: IclR family transcriptional regulator [Streptosporangiaceae bacterium]|jgi:IclR family acetate operon transcriptional repressor